MLNLTLPKKLFLIAFSFALALTALAVSAHSLNHQEALKLNQAGKILPAQEILNLALTAKPEAQLIKMKLKQHQENYYYKLKLATPNQEVHKLVYDASNGQLIKERSKQMIQRQHKNRSEHRKNMQEKRQHPMQNKRQQPRNQQPTK